ncbi:MAG: amidotransferase [Candidatus Viridilinea halotolerans]|uniref:Amidotransferase n=1 Tax=Candidatus Viridilinea halotolerans TaxID=2491704 RepID=A0A426TWZ7_9CHLR|nr:MAG: amidotransferase [Candidatus Viridilinea halotolerans]
MRAHALQHVPFEGLGSIEPWLLAKGYTLTYTQFFASADLPDPQTIDLLVIMGGPMSVHDEDAFPWLALEKQFVRETIAAGKAVLGVCLGAQMIASAMGANVWPNPVKEIGWFPIQAVATPTNDEVFNFPPAQVVFHWHGETFDLPSGALRLARSEGCANQAFQLGRRIIGLQFHLETTPQSANEIVVNCRDELVPARYVQTAEEILAVSPSRYAAINALMDQILAFL